MRPAGHWPSGGAGRGMEGAQPGYGADGTGAKLAEGRPEPRPDVRIKPAHQAIG